MVSSLRRSRLPPLLGKDILFIRRVCAFFILVSYAIGAFCVFSWGYDRSFVANALIQWNSIWLLLLFVSAFLPFPSLRRFTFYDRTHSSSIMFLFVSYLRHLTWDLGWFFFNEKIKGSRDALWAYPWWVFFDGGNPISSPVDSPQLLATEILSLIHGFIGFCALFNYTRTAGNSAFTVHILMFSSVVYLYSFSLSYLSELVQENPDEIFCKLQTIPWAFMCVIVIVWGMEALRYFPQKVV